MRAVGQAGDKTESRPYCVFSEIRDNAEPCEESLLGKIEAGCRQPLRQRLLLEIDRSEGEPGGRWDLGVDQAFALPGLCGRVVDLEDACAVTKRAAVGISIQAG